MSQQAVPRSCTIAASLAVIGEKWSLLVVRELSLGVHRFDAIQRNTGAPRDILTSRLRRLEAEGVVGARWWTRAELDASDERFGPPDLPARVRTLLA